MCSRPSRVDGLPRSSALPPASSSPLLLAMLLPARYRSSGTILIEQQELPADLVRSTVTSFADQRIQVISQRVMTTETLLKLIHRFELYADERGGESREELIERMRSDIDFRMISADVIDPRSGRADRRHHRVRGVVHEPGSREGGARRQRAHQPLSQREPHAARAPRRRRVGIPARRRRSARASASRAGDRSSRSSRKNTPTRCRSWRQLNLELLDRAEQQLRAARVAAVVARSAARVPRGATRAAQAEFGQCSRRRGERILSATDRLEDRCARSSRARRRCMRPIIRTSRA